MSNKSTDELYNIDILDLIMINQEHLLSSDDLDTKILKCFKSIAELMKVSRVYIFENSTQNNNLCTSLLYEFNNKYINEQINNKELQNISYADKIPRWLEAFNNHKQIEGIVSTFPDKERKILESKNILSLICIPIYFDGILWGFMGYDDCVVPRVWSSPEKKILKILSNSIISTIFRVRRSEELLFQKEAFEILYQKSSDAVLIIENGIFIDANESAVNMLNANTKDELISIYNTDPSTLSPKLQPDGINSLKKAQDMMEICTKNGMHSFEWIHISSKGTKFWTEVVLTQIKTVQKEIIHVVLRNISKRKENEVLLSLHQKKLSLLNDALVEKIDKEAYLRKELDILQKYQKAIFNGEPNMILTKLNGLYNHDANYAFFEFFGYDDLVSFTKDYDCVCEFFIQRDGYLGSKIDGVDWIQYIKKYPNKVHNVIMKKMQKEYFFNININEITIDKDMFAIISFTDITELENYKNTLETRIDEEVKRNREKDRLLHNQSKSVQMGEMINMIAHQWRQPLNAISASAISIEMRQELGELDENFISEHSKFVQQHTQGMSKTINDFMDFFKPEQKMQHFRLEDLLSGIFSLMGAQITSRNIKLNFISDNEKKIYSYKKELAHVLINLISNSRDAFETNKVKEKQILVELSEDDFTYFVKVIDNAGGIPEDIIDQIFNPYFTTKEQGKGTGIGLHMSKRIVNEVFKGKIEVKNSNNGAEFKITIPKYFGSVV